VSDVLDIGGGRWGLVKRRSQQFFLPPPYEEVADKIRKRLELQQRAERTKAVVEDYGRRMKITYNEELLAKL
jgi:hypothetical protein